LHVELGVLFEKLQESFLIQNRRDEFSQKSSKSPKSKNRKTAKTIAQRKSCASSKTPPRLFFLASRKATKSRDCREFPFSKRFEILDSCDFWFDF
jgi:hypothetical protein